MKFFWRNVKLILKDKTLPKEKRRKLFLSYARIKWSSLFNSRQAIKHAPYKNKFLGHNIMFFNYDDLLFLIKEIFIKKEYYFKMETAIPFIIDCGSNIGISLIYYKYLYPDCRIVAFEPDSRTFDVLKYNIHNNNLKNIELINKAVYNYEGKISFYSDPDHPGIGSMSTVKERLPKEPSIVDTALLSNYINQRIDFLKLDIEGAEELVMEEVSQSGKIKLINAMVIEYHHHIEPKEDNLSVILKILEDNGFGYQLISLTQRFPARETFQDILIYAYQKNPALPQA